MTEQFQLFDLLPDEEYAALKDDIAKRGVLVPIEYDQDGNLLDGHHRLRACFELGIKDFPTITRQFGSTEEREEHIVTLNVRRRHLNGEQKRRWVAWFLARHPERSDREIGREVGVHQSTVGSVRRDLEDSGELSKLDSRRGRDGKIRRMPSIFTSSRHRERAQTALTTLGDSAPPRQLELKRAERIAREQEAEKRRQEAIQSVTTTGDVEIRHGDFRKVLTDLHGRVDAIITDPPYPKEFGDLWGELGDVSRQLLKPNGVLAVMCGTRLELLYAAENAIGQHMRRRWMGAYLTPGHRWRDQVERVATGWKPILIYSHPDGDTDNRRWIQDDVFNASEGSSADKRFHHWGQNEAGFADLVGRLSEPGALVVDPFLGGGTTAVVCRDLGRRFIGCDIDAAAIHVSRERVG